ncbi:hypothetical protein K435DRAFT_582147, partial [Dendrothele bispora CBS 962.96]
VSQLVAFILVCTRIKNNILLLYPSNYHPNTVPPLLPDESIAFLQRTCNLDREDVEACWNAVKEDVWQGDKVLKGVEHDKALQQTFQKYGGELYPSFRSLWPPYSFCTNPDCKYVINDNGRKLQRAIEHEGILYTVTMGPIPVRTHQFTCDGCGVVYHPDYYVQTILETDERRRIYYNKEELPEILQVSTHHFVETALVRMWRSNMVHAWVSASNCARVYEDCWPEVTLPPDWTVNAILRYEYVYDGFKILSLLEFHQRHQSVFHVPQSIDQLHRFDDAMEEMNQYIKIHGQQEINHRCNKCVRHILKDSKVLEIFAVICDGVTVGRPCCGVPHCEGKLVSIRNAFCEMHADKNMVCRVKGCNQPIKTKGAKACINPEHQAAEKRYTEAGTAAFQLKQRYERARRA